MSPDWLWVGLKKMGMAGLLGSVEESEMQKNENIEYDPSAWQSLELNGAWKSLRDMNHGVVIEGHLRV